ncbi:MAG TPA: SMP-30/gluconolactonase/LRE family protein [Myxococcaceae bacterium]|nr:SMP-30/gluconolactonase/LRE family protein [Myxococcaceae bacterium]
MRSLSLTPFVLLVALVGPPASAWLRGAPVTFATLPEGAAFPEGITADALGNLYVATFDVSASTGPGRIFVFAPSGQLLRRLDVAGSTPFLLGVAFHPSTRALLVVDFGGKAVLKVDPLTGASSVFAAIPGGAGAGPNAIAFDRAGNVYVSDSFQGVVWRTGPQGGAALSWLNSALLRTAGVPPFGANGLAFNRAENALFLANTGDDTVVRIPVAGGAAGTPEVFVHSINGADGLMVDGDDNIWVAANQADEIVVVDPSGRAIAKLGDFGGLDSSGAPRGFLFPASLVRSGEFVYVTNLALDLRLFGLAPSVDAQWAAAVRRYTVARIPAQLPPVPGLR